MRFLAPGFAGIDVVVEVVPDIELPTGDPLLCDKSLGTSESGEGRSAGLFSIH
jgi:hypothetical protein